MVAVVGAPALALAARDCSADLHGFEPIHQRQTVLFGCMPQEQEDQCQSNAYTNYVLFQTASHTAGLRLLRETTRI